MLLSAVYSGFLFLVVRPPAVLGGVGCGERGVLPDQRCVTCKEDMKKL